MFTFPEKWPLKTTNRQINWRCAVKGEGAAVIFKCLCGLEDIYKVFLKAKVLVSMCGGGAVFGVSFRFVLLELQGNHLPSVREV